MCFQVFNVISIHIILPLLYATTSFVIYGSIGLLLLLISSALISGAEVAFFSLTKNDIETQIDQGNKPFFMVEKLLDKPKKLLATILVANNFINIAVVILFDAIGDVIFSDVDSEINFGWFQINMVFFIKVIVATFIILLFGEILPKIYASRNSIKFVKLVVYPLNVLDKVFAPLSLPMQAITTGIHNKLGKQKTNLSVDQLSQALELTTNDDTTNDEHKILKGIVSFGNIDVKQVMRPRIDVFALDSTSKYVNIIPEIIKKGFSRIPVFTDSMDNIIGILYIKDLLPHIEKKQFNWLELLREPLYVPENKKLDDLMVEFQEKKIHLSIVVDEYGGTSGLISLDNIIEEIVGDIGDEFDDDDLIYTKLDDANYIFEGKTTLQDFYRIIKLEDTQVFEDAKGESETIAGFILEQYKGFPKIGSKITFNNFTFKIEALSKKRIKDIKVKIK